jgi:hypothetical protein
MVWHAVGRRPSAAVMARASEPGEVDRSMEFREAACFVVTTMWEAKGAIRYAGTTAAPIARMLPKILRGPRVPGQLRRDRPRAAILRFIRCCRIQSLPVFEHACVVAEHLACAMTSHQSRNV